MPIFLSKSFAMGLCAYLHQANLSIDRSLGHLDQTKNENTTLRNYYCSDGQLHPLEVADKLSRIFSEPQLSSSRFGHFSQELLPFRLWNWFIRYKVVLQADDLAFIKDKLTALDTYLAGNLVARRKIVDLRMDLAHSSILLAKRIFSPAFTRSLRKVEHYNQNEILKTIPISRICGTNSWLTV